MLKILLAPAFVLYKAGVTFRHRLFDWGILKSEKFDIPIICIGNITDRRHWARPRWPKW